MSAQKADLPKEQWVVPTKEAEGLAVLLGVPLMVNTTLPARCMPIQQRPLYEQSTQECSAKEDHNVREAFQNVAEQIYGARDKRHPYGVPA